MNQTELEALTITELYDLAKQHGIPSYRKYKKAQLIDMLQAPAPEKKKRGRPAKEKVDAPAAAEKAPQQKKRGRSAKAAETQEIDPAQQEPTPVPASVQTAESSVETPQPVSAV